MENNISRCFKADILANTQNFKAVGTQFDSYFKFGMKTSYPQYNPRLMILYDKGEKSKPMPYFMGNHNPQTMPQMEQTNDWFKFEVKYIRDDRLVQSNLITMFFE